MRLPSEIRADFLVAAGAIGAYPRLAQTVLTLLDIAQPLTPCRILVDSAGMLGRFHAIAGVNGEAALSVLKSDMLVNAGVCLSLLGKARPGESVAEIVVTRASSMREEDDKEETYTIRYGSITVVPVRSTENAAIRVTTSRKHSFELDPAGVPGQANRLSCRAPRRTA